MDEEKTRKRTILAIVDFGTTGIAESLLSILHHWHNQGHEIWQLALGYNGWTATVDKKRYPWHERLLPIFGGVDNDTRFGQNCIAQALKLSKAEIVITAFDIWMIDYLGRPELYPKLDTETKSILDRNKRPFTHIAYFPIDGAVEGKYLPSGMDEMIAGFDIPVTYSRFAKSLIHRDMNIDVPFIPIAHDPKIYKPGSRANARKKMNIPNDRFIVGMVGTNQYRKRWDDFFKVVVPFAKRHKDVAILPWTSWDQKIMGGTEISDLVWRSGLGEQIIDCRAMVHGLSDEGMGLIYQTLDVLLLTTVGEGAGLPPLRARACGVPALVSANTSNIEFCADPFEAVPNRASFFDPFGSNLERYLTDTDEMEHRLETLYQDSILRKRIGNAGIEEMKQYELDRIMPMWDEILEGIK